MKVDKKEFILEEGKKYKYQFGKKIAATLTGFIIGVIIGFLIGYATYYVFAYASTAAAPIL